MILEQFIDLAVDLFKLISQVLNVFLNGDANLFSEHWCPETILLLRAHRRKALIATYQCLKSKNFWCRRLPWLRVMQAAKTSDQRRIDGICLGTQHLTLRKRLDTARVNNANQVAFPV